MFSKYVNFILVIVGGALLALVLFLSGLQMWLVFTLVMIFTFVFTMGYPFYIIYKSKSLRLIDQYLTNHRSKPIFGYAHALAHGTDEEIINQLNKILKSYANAEVQEIYKANLLVFQKNWRGLIDFSKSMENVAYRDYYAGIGYTMSNNMGKASEYLQKLRTPWIVHSLKAIIAMKQKKQDQFQTEVRLATKSAVGMQRFVLHHMLNRMAEGVFSTKEK
ncbi:hypothetical protein [Sporosarcina highlanderae]|uniref:DUF2892 domain-containing protein n=1 Tax=Sporosarcina highlanderae TaxID=3035916 RepID=A0ABT8JLP3_9BACL|nr:hypothetical protein [Sporosarcina highlanderae]MDN4606068.1 hypothetical protein [Sporosarcina highlanderae]